MDHFEILSYASTAILISLYLSLPVVVSVTLFGLLVSVLQALTQIQDQTLAFLVKLIVSILVMFMTASWFGKVLYGFTVSVMDALAYA